MDYDKTKQKVDELVKSWGDEIALTVLRRELREPSLSTRAMRASGALKQDEFLTVVRTIDTNIRREIPAYINYLKNSRRLAILEDRESPTVQNSPLEDSLTDGWTYTEWETAFYRLVDGTCTHGWDFMEVAYDETKPLNVAFQHVGHDKLIFPTSATNIQNCVLICRQYDLTKIQLEDFVKKYDFDAEQVRILTSEEKDSNKQDKPYKIHKCFYKVDGVVYAGWLSIDRACTSWLKKPTQLYIGIDRQMKDVLTGAITWSPATVDMYPFVILPYTESEQQIIFSYKGRVYLDTDTQEAQTAILSNFLTATNRATRVFGSPKSSDLDGAAPKQLDIKLTDGTFFDKAVDFWNMPYPDPSVLSALQFLATSKSNETSQVNFAVQNRKDSRKTATEIQASNQSSAQLSSVQLTMFSTALRQLFTIAWKITQSQALQGRIALLKNVQTGVDNLTGQPILSNNMNTLSRVYDIRAAGDVDVIKREEKLQQMMSFWPVVSATPAAIPFLKDMLKIMFPENATSYITALSQPNDLIPRLAMVVAELAKAAQLSPEDMTNIKTLLAEAAQQSQQAPV